MSTKSDPKSKKSERYDWNEVVECLKEEDEDGEEWFVATIQVLYEWPKSEAMYCWEYGKPLPQAIASLSDGTSQKYIGEEALKKFVRKTTRRLSGPKPLKFWLRSVKFNGKLLINQIKNLHPYINGLLDKECFDPNIGDFSLGEFGREEIVFRSNRIGRVMRNCGQHGFILKLFIDGYAPATMELEINETLFFS